MAVSEYINHFGVIRIRVVGSGAFKMTLYSLDDIKSHALTDITLEATTDRQPTKLANFKTMNARLKLETTEIDEHFQVDGILVYIKPSETSYPQ